jgi:hypothetical protein
MASRPRSVLPQTCRRRTSFLRSPATLVMAQAVVVVAAYVINLLLLCK